VPQKTRAVERLLALVPEHEHAVYSLNRVGWRRGVAMLPFGEAHRAVAYGAPPKSLMLATRLAPVAEAIVEDAAARGLRPDLVHAHKLSVDGLVAERVAAALGVPYAVSSWGDTDLRILGARPDLMPRWRRVWHGAAAAFCLAPWTAAALEARLGARAAPPVLLPCALAADRVIAPRETGPVIRTAFHLAVWRRKNATGLIRAARLAARAAPGLRLEIAGGGDPDGFAALADAARGAAPADVRLLGPVPAEAIPGLFNAAAAMALPSFRESFGMVFVEALFAGCPVLWPRGWAVDGWLGDGEAGLAVDARDTAAVADGIARLVAEERAFKTRLARLQETGALDGFRREAIAATYRGVLGRFAAAAPEAGRGRTLPGG